MAKKSIALVIDADIARAAGGEDATHSTPKNCRDFLKAVLKHYYILVMTSEIKAEWKKHQSLFAKKWLQEMYGRKRIRVARPEHDEELCKRTEEAGESIKQRNAIFTLVQRSRKDFHLVEAALATDQRIVSMDQKMRHLLSIAATKKGVKELRAIVWINPDKSEEQALAWLKDGAPHEPKRCLGYEEQEGS